MTATPATSSHPHTAGGPAGEDPTLRDRVSDDPATDREHTEPGSPDTETAEPAGTNAESTDPESQSDLASDAQRDIDATPLADDVVAVVATSRPDQLTGVLDAIAAGELIPGHLVIIAAEQAPDLGPSLAAHRLPRLLTSTRVKRIKGELSPQLTTSAALSHVPDDSSLRYLWPLTEDSRPAPAALARLHRAALDSRSAAVIAPKVRTTARPPELLSVGYPITRAGRWVQQPRVGEADQGQYDDRSDVLATSSVGALIDIDALKQVNGWAPKLRGSADAVAADIDLGWRLHRHGRRVLIEPRAVVEIETRHASEDADLPTAASPIRLTAGARRSLRAIALGAMPLAGWIIRIPAVLITALATAFLMVLAKRPGAAARELVDGLAVLRLGRAWSAHRRFAPAKAVSRRALRQLFVTRDQARHATYDEIIPERRHREALSQQDLELRGQRPQAVAHPAFLAVLVGLALVLVQGRDLGGSLTGRLGWGVTGGEVVGSTATGESLWRTAVDAWGGPGLGAEPAWSPALAVLAVATKIAENLPFLDAPSAPAATTVAALLFVALPLSALTMYAALTLITPRRSVRGLGGIAWAATGLASDTIAEGRLGGAVVLVLLPLGAAALARALSARGRSFDAAQTGLVFALIGAFAPAVAALSLVLGVLLGLVPRWSFRRALGAAIVPVVVLAPFVRELWESPQAAFGGVGLFAWGTEVPPVWRLALLDVSSRDTEGLAPVIADALPFVAAPLVALALLGLLRGRRRLLSLAAILVGALALAAAAVASRIDVDTVPLGTAGAGEAVRPWAGGLLAIYALVVIGLAVRGLDLLARLGLRRRAYRVLVPLAGLVAVGGLVAATAWSGFGSTLSTFKDPRSAVAVDHADGPLAGRTLLVQRLTQDEGVEAATAYRLLAAEGGLPVRTLPVPVETSEELDAFVSRLDVAALSGGGEDLPGGAAAVLARHAVGFIAITDDLPAESARSLDSTEGLRRLPDRDDLRWWRVDSTTSENPSPARVILREDNGDGVAVPSWHHAQTTAKLRSGGTLEIAETRAWARVASVTLDGEDLAATAEGPTMTYAVPTSGDLVIELERPDRELRLLAIVGLVVIAYLALPFGGARSRGPRAAERGRR